MKRITTPTYGRSDLISAIISVVIGIVLFVLFMMALSTADAGDKCPCCPATKKCEPARVKPRYIVTEMPDINYAPRTEIVVAPDSRRQYLAPTQALTPREQETFFTELRIRNPQPLIATDR